MMRLLETLSKNTCHPNILEKKLEFCEFAFSSPSDIRKEFY